ncbi:THO complex subunit 7 homolog isoform X2 [Patella vulgata]|uniref:THO complex subunit 7 homolog isoform X2 n=1 Tax=Patella vulgata TaxID=6465 RepID=UPI00217F8319|nr:THO complex subunit 7 homolog isoform X2 [Patella vulgata]
MAVSDDDIIKRRLLIDGEGGNDDKRLNNLLKMFIRWTQSPVDEDSNMVYQRILSTISQCEYTLEKSVKVYQMNLEEQQNYETLNQRIENKIEEATLKITECKSELQQAKRIRKNRQEYDALAKVIHTHPDRQATTKQLESLDQELKTFKDRKQKLEEKLDSRRKQFLVLITAIHELQAILDEDEKKAEIEEQKTEEMETS